MQASSVFLRMVASVAILAGPLFYAARALATECPDEVPFNCGCESSYKENDCTATNEFNCLTDSAAELHAGKFCCVYNDGSDKQCLNGTEKAPCYTFWYCEWDEIVEECQKDAASEDVNEEWKKTDLDCSF